MPEPLSIAVGAFEIAAAGLKLAENLRIYIDNARRAEKQLTQIADHVRLTSDVLTNISTLLENDDIRNLYTDLLLKSTVNALDGCRQAFEDLKKFLSKICKMTHDGGISVSFSARLLFSLKQKELDVLQARLERFKSSLDLVLAVLNVLSSAKVAKDTSVLSEMRADIRHLLEVEQEAKSREALLVQLLEESKAKETSLPTPTMAANISNQGNTRVPLVCHARIPPVTSSVSAANATVDSATTPGASDSVTTTRSASTSSPGSDVTPQETILHYLADCAHATENLRADIEKAIVRWNTTALYEPRCLRDALQTISTAVLALSEYESRLPVNPKPSFDEELAGAIHSLGFRPRKFPIPPAALQHALAGEQVDPAPEAVEAEVDDESSEPLQSPLLPDQSRPCTPIGEVNTGLSDAEPALPDLMLGGGAADEGADARPKVEEVEDHENGATELPEVDELLREWTTLEF